MTRIAVISDTHGNLGNLRLVRQVLGPVDGLLHAGDFLSDAAEAAALLGVDPSRVWAVAGNCDAPVREPEALLFSLDGVRILLTHGHQFGVNQSLDRLYYRAGEREARVAVFGHTHAPYLDDDGEVMLLNPGSLSKPRPRGERPSCILLELTAGDAAAKILYLDA